MPLGENSDIIQVVVSKGIKEKVESAASEENRSISNWVLNLIKDKLN